MSRKQLRELSARKTRLQLELKKTVSELDQMRKLDRIQNRCKHIGKCYKNTYFHDEATSVVAIRVIDVDTWGSLRAKQISRNPHTVSVHTQTMNDIEPNNWKPITEEEYRKILNSALQDQMEK